MNSPVREDHQQVQEINFDALNSGRTENSNASGAGKKKKEKTKKRKSSKTPSNEADSVSSPYPASQLSPKSANGSRFTSPRSQQGNNNDDEDIESQATKQSRASRLSKPGPSVEGSTAGRKTMEHLSIETGAEEESELVQQGEISGGVALVQAMRDEELEEERRQEEEKHCQQLQEIEEVEQRLQKTRQMINLTIMNVELTDLPAVHRFTKNNPWLKGSYGEGYSWVVDYEEADLGDRAMWKNMRWSFDLERNEEDRNDLVLTVCSKNLVIGRYVLAREEFKDVPDTKSGYFEVSGEILSGLGYAGKVKLLMLKSKAARPKAPTKDISSTVNYLTDVALSPVKDQEEDEKAAKLVAEATTPGTLRHAMMFHDKIFVKIISMAVMDLKSAHFLDANSPFVTLECGEWVGISDVVPNAGMAARWNSLNWKFAMTEDIGFDLRIHSKTVLIGRLNVSLDEVVAREPKQNGVIDIIKHLTNGRELVGKVKINLIAHTPTDVDATMRSSPVNMSPVGGERTPKRFSADSADGENTRAIDLDNPNGTNRQMPMRSTRSAADKSNRLPLIVAPAADLNDNGDLVLMKPFIKPPFIVNVRDITVLDTVKMHVLKKNSLVVNCVCGSWGKATEEIKGAGSFAHWIALGWKVLVLPGSYFRITVWSSGKAVGSASLSVNDLLDMPTDFERNTEIFAKLYNEKSEITGKVKISCKYDVYVEKPKSPTKKSNRSGTPSKKTAYSPNKSTSSLPRIASAADHNSMQRSYSGENIAGSASRIVTPYEMMEGDEEEEKDDLPDNLAPKEELTLPVIAVIKSISLYDMVPAHKVFKNSPQVRIICDRKSAVTEVQAGAGSVANWSNLKWMMKVRLDTLFRVEVSSRNVNLGRIDIDPRDLIDIPLNDSGLTEIKTVIKKDDVTTTKLFILMLLKNFEEPLYQPPSSPEQRTLPDGLTPLSQKDRFDWGETGYSSRVPLAASQDPIASKRFITGANTSQRAASPSVRPYSQQYSPNASVSGVFQQEMPQRPYGTPSSDVIINNSAFMDNALSTPYNSAYQPLPLNPHIESYHSTVPKFSERLLDSQSQEVIFDPRALSGHNATKLGLVFNLTIHEIDLIDLKQMHTFSHNCPYVSAACGKWTETSEPLNNAGEIGYWTNLMWKCNFKGGANLRLLVNSKKKTIGTISFTSEQLLDSWTDDKGLRRVMGYLVDEEGNKNGKIKVAYTMDVSKSNVAASTRGPLDARSWDGNSVYSERQGISRVGSAASAFTRRSGSPVQGGVIHAGAYDRGGGVPHAATVGGFSTRSGSPIPLRPHSYSPHSVTYSNLMTAQREQMIQQQQQTALTRHRSVSSSRPGSAGAQSRISDIGFSASAQPSPRPGRQSPSPLTPGGGRGIAEMSYPPSGSPTGSPPPGMMRDPSAGFDHSTLPNDLIDQDPRRNLQFPFNITIVEMSTVDLQSMHTLSKNSPYIRIYCDDYYNETMAHNSSSDVDYFRDLHWTFRVNDRSIFKILVCSRDKDVGSSVVDLESLKNTPMDSYGLREFVVHIRDSKKYTGKVRILVRLENAATAEFEAETAYGVGEGAFENSMMDGIGANGPSPVDAPVTPGSPTSPVGGQTFFSAHSTTGGGHSVGGGQSIAGGPSVAGGQASVGGGPSIAESQSKGGALSDFMPGNSIMSVPSNAPTTKTYARNFEYFMQSQRAAAQFVDDFPRPVGFTIVGIATIDMPSVHTFKENSPSVNAACGKYIFTTDIKESAGKLANWEKLNFQFKMTQSGTLRLLVSSRDTVIGTCQVKRKSLLGGRKNQRGTYVYFDELETSKKKPAGKIKLIYAIDENN